MNSQIQHSCPCHFVELHNFNSTQHYFCLRATPTCSRISSQCIPYSWADSGPPFIFCTKASRCASTPTPPNPHHPLSINVNLVIIDNIIDNIIFNKIVSIIAKSSLTSSPTSLSTSSSTSLQNHRRHCHQHHCQIIISMFINIIVNIIVNIIAKSSSTLSSTLSSTSSST